VQIDPVHASTGLHPSACARGGIEQERIEHRSIDLVPPRGVVAAEPFHLPFPIAPPHRVAGGAKADAVDKVGKSGL
jgi:hypothetical protein